MAIEAYLRVQSSWRTRLMYCGAPRYDFRLPASPPKKTPFKEGGCGFEAYSRRAGELTLKPSIPMYVHATARRPPGVTLMDLSPIVQDEGIPFRTRAGERRLLVLRTGCHRDRCRLLLLAQTLALVLHHCGLFREA